MKYSFSPKRTPKVNFVQSIIDEVNEDILIVQSGISDEEIEQVLISLYTLKSLAHRIGNQLLEFGIRKRIQTIKNKTMTKRLYGELGQNA
jgi:hypothetical protein